MREGKGRARKNGWKKEGSAYLIQRHFWKKGNGVWSVQRCSKVNILKNRNPNFDHKFFETKNEVFGNPWASCLLPEFVAELYDIILQIAFIWIPTLFAFSLLFQMLMHDSGKEPWIKMNNKVSLFSINYFYF